MKKIFKTVIMLTIFGFTTIICNGQTVDEIIDKHIEAHGGMENWDKVQSIKITGQFTSFSETYPFSEIKARPDYYYSTFQMGQHQITEAGRGNDFWTINPWFDLSFPRKVNSVEEGIIHQKAEFCTPFFNYKERGFTVAYEGTEELEGVDVFKLVLTCNNGHVETWFLDTETYLEYMSRSDWSDFASPTPQEAIYDDFRQVGDIIIPFYMERVFSIRHRVIEIEDVELNVEPDAAIFGMPLSEEMQKLKFLEGTWDVSLDVLTRSGAWANADSTTSIIEFLPNKNMLLETISYIRFFPVDKLISWTYNTDTQKYRVGVFNDFYSNAEMLQGNFNNDTLTIENTEIKWGEDTENPGYVKYIFSNISDDGFLLETASSMDKGETWAVRQKFTYTRKLN
nr:hypothetical protein [Bacteroidota bacterium]